MERLRRSWLRIGPGSHDGPVTRPRHFAREVLAFTGAEHPSQADRLSAAASPT